MSLNIDYSQKYENRMTIESKTVWRICRNLTDKSLSINWKRLGKQTKKISKIKIKTELLNFNIFNYTIWLF